MLRLISLILSSLFFFFVVQPVFADQSGTLLPVSDGTYTQWTPKSGSTHYTMVDEASCNGITDYNSETTLNQRESYGISLSSIPNGSTITQIDITPCASKNSNGGSNSTMKVFYRLNGANSTDSGSYSLSGITPVNLSTTAYSGLSAVKGSLTTLEIGAVYTAGNRGARLGRIASVITYTPLSSPSGLIVDLGGANSAILRWMDNSSNETGFRIERSLDGVSGWTLRGADGANTIVFTDTNLTLQQPYYYRVYAFNNGGNSGYSNVYSINTDIPNNPTHVALTASVCGGSPVPMTLDWIDNAFNETGFEIEVNYGSGYVPFITLGQDVVKYSFSGIECDYRIRAVNSFGNSDWAYVELIR